MKDPYTVLGVQRGDSEETIRTAYRRLAKKHHPDLNPDKPEAIDRFKEISAAYEIVGDTDKRARFDRGEIDAAGNERPPERPRGYRDFGDTDGQARYGAGDFSTEDLADLFGDAFGQSAGRRRRGGAGFRANGPDVSYSLTIDFMDAAAGAVRRLTLPDGRTLDVTIPAGTRDGHVLRLKGQGMPGIGGGAAGDALVEVSVAPHPFFRREGDDIHLDLPVTVQEAVLGTAIEVPTVKGTVRVTVPPGSGTGTKLRLRGRGINDGNQVVELRVVLPPGEEPALAEFMRTWKPDHPFDPRAGLRSGRGAP